MKRIPFPLILMGAAIVLLGVAAQAQGASVTPGAVAPVAPTSGFSSQYVQVVPSAAAQLPACSPAFNGAKAIVSDALLPAFLQAVTGGGMVETGVLCNGSAWVVD